MGSDTVELLPDRDDNPGVIVERVELDGVDGPVATIIHRPDRPGPHPAIALGAEATGVNQFLRRIAATLAARGFVTALPDYFRGGGPRDVSRRLGVQGLEALAAVLEHHGDEVHHAHGLGERPLHQFGIAHIAVGELDLAHLAHHLELGGEVRLAGGHAHAPPVPRQRAHHVAAHEARAAEDRDQTLHRARRFSSPK